ncbi:hypothetical protein F2P81_024479 [Scophthalmus maximus]|uniref:Uncharacterized protein n=1 Tax=Scophthalmus maximus TaxID=52904 RepID=A0A6A4RUA9_SCOMX|nr:hypothetical protein F2P81_024479 [Scophthalmus maximus]
MDVIVLAPCPVLTVQPKTNVRDDDDDDDDHRPVLLTMRWPAPELRVAGSRRCCHLPADVEPLPGGRGQRVLGHLDAERKNRLTGSR